ncbi:MAG: preprotein translocase subunit SecA, partial [Patescibacteria group bacterium]|nr:preprotein translocase subunit SecA [Patescibacteria group bacterium]
EKLRAVTLTEAGIAKMEKWLGMENVYAEGGFQEVHHIEQALKAQAIFKNDIDYVVKDGEVIIVDEFTGRLMPGRRWSDGLHQAVEAKEGVHVQKESRTLATITFQNYFRIYGKLAGMTGTAETSAEEFHKVYGLDVVAIPTNKPMVRADLADLIFRTEAGKFRAVVREVKKRHADDQPVLIGTVSIAQNERLSKMLEIEGVRHTVLNAKNHEQEALIIAEAGKSGAGTVATNMAGRGVDIILGGGEVDSPEADAVRRAGGLHVIGTERHEARRIDNQLRGRAGRQGDPGSSQFFVSLEDNLMRVFGSDKIKRLMETLGIPEDEPIEARMVSRALESAQAKIEGFHFDARKHVLDYDDVLNKQRDAIYRMRRGILFNERSAGKNEDREKSAESADEKNKNTTLRERILAMVEDEVARIVAFHAAVPDGSAWDVEEMVESVGAIAALPHEAHARLLEIRESNDDDEKKRAEMTMYLSGLLRTHYAEREAAIGMDGMRNIERGTLLGAIDALWMDHLDQMEHLRDSVRLRAYG